MVGRVRPDALREEVGFPSRSWSVRGKVVQAIRGHRSGDGALPSVASCELGIHVHIYGLVAPEIPERVQNAHARELELRR